MSVEDEPTVLKDPVLQLKIPSYLKGKVPIIGRYHGNELNRTLEISKALTSIGFEGYPSAEPQRVTLVGRDGAEFNFFGGNVMVEPPFMVQLGFFRALRKSDIDPVRNFSYVAIQNGYLGRTAIIEVAYAMASGKRLIFSESPAVYSSEVSSEVASVVQDNHQKYPVVPIEKVPSAFLKAQIQKIEHPILSEAQKNKIYLEILGLERDLRKQFGFRLN